MKAVRFSVS